MSDPVTKVIEERLIELETTVAYQQETIEALQTNLAKLFQVHQHFLKP